ncbi:arsenite efflux transporter metallochaperone ArsD [Isachenkonia alkalipeptolytica]|uniref:Arsenite efflux transporter metallochaperone ArsD n=1 Tax=Isachenkonia alkalipeptolytica TaxID=2565777 RepID=A0AA43XI25_9CLOT|nr:arsenite efflux transporter metallochaperone ArsD [Isachenkonia alkalipeptolytica]NBG87182.1 arsenite efflux transporter metallochaperone ArsD [Isachenkonia alkalipeptolytica]
MKIQVYDPPMCCSTGICGPSVDDKLVRFNENLKKIENKHPDTAVERYMITQQPLKFRENQEVFKLVKEKGREILPITTVNDKIIKYGDYPDIEEIENAL